MCFNAPHEPLGFAEGSGDRRHRLDRVVRRRARLSVPRPGPRDQERRPADGARIAGRAGGRAGPARRSVRAGPPRARDAEPADLDEAQELAARLQEPVQDRGLLLLAARQARSALGDAAADHAPRQGVGLGPGAALRQAHLSNRRPADVLSTHLGNARAVHDRRPRSASRLSNNPVGPPRGRRQSPAASPLARSLRECVRSSPCSPR